jgi:tripartite-type tricarboxylate transporter receptor subunit TctC
MRVVRRDFLRLAAAAPAVSLLPQAILAPGALADTYPSRPVRLVVGYTAGSAPDVAARVLADWLSGSLGQQFVTDDRPGAGTNISTETVVRANPDGYTLLLIATPNMISGLLHSNLSFNFQRDIIPVGSLGGTPFVVVSNPDFPPKTIPELVAYAKANPGKVNFTSNGTGNLSHIAGEMFKMMADVDLFHIPGHGEVEAQTDLIAGRAQIMFDPIISAIGHVKAGKLRALAVTTDVQLDSMPGVPTVNESVPGYVVDGWLGFGAPAGTPPDIVAKLNQAVGAGLEDDKVRSRLVDLGNVPTKMSAADYGKLIAIENEKWAKVIKFAGIKLD